MRLDVGGVDGDLFRRPGQGLRQSREQVLPMAALRPAVLAIVNRRRRAVSRRAVAPPAARLENVNDAADDPPVIHAPLVRRVVRKMRLDRRPLLVFDASMSGRLPGESPVPRIRRRPSPHRPRPQPRYSHARRHGKRQGAARLAAVLAGESPVGAILSLAP